MFLAARTTDFSNGESVSVWERTIDRIIAEAEAAERDLSVLGVGTAREARKASGSFYTPADVADHVWDQLFRQHRIADAAALRHWATHFRLVEPSAGSGIFLFTFLRKALRMGLSPVDLRQVGFSIIDINDAALRFVRLKIGEVEDALGVALDGIELVERDFLKWAATTHFDHVAFVGNPPFVSNPRGSRWRNVFADFLTAMMDYRSKETAIGLILPMSICFSRDYEALRERILNGRLGLSASSYDNIPDCLFKAGKPESTNSNKANSQRCTVLLLGGPDEELREASDLRRWSAAERATMLQSSPRYVDVARYKFDGQIPRPAAPNIMDYLASSSKGRTVGDLMHGGAKPLFGLAAIARNFIGIRDAVAGDTSCIAIGAASAAEEMVLLQVLSSPAFYQYWLSLGDGFHVTRDLVKRFPISDDIRRLCVGQVGYARSIWKRRSSFAREKLNSGKIIRSYDFRGTFPYVSVDAPPVASTSAAATDGGRGLIVER